MATGFLAKWVERRPLHNLEDKIRFNQTCAEEWHNHFVRHGLAEYADISAKWARDARRWLNLLINDEWGDFTEAPPYEGES